jgi:uroporphyrinogen III methyltransferase/synthase
MSKSRIPNLKSKHIGEGAPLSGKRIVVTRALAQAAELSEPLRALGAEVLELPTINILPAKDPTVLREAIEGIGEYDWIIFTSPNAVDFFFEEFFRQYKDIRALGFVKIAAMGAGTEKRLSALHLEVDLQPEEAVAEAMVRAFQEQMDVANVRFLLPRSDIARAALAVELEKLGAIVDSVEAYRNVLDASAVAAAERLLKDGADVVTFASSSAVENFCKVVDVVKLREKFPKLVFASIGPITTRTATECGLEIGIEAKEHSVAGLVEALRRGLRAET